MNSKTITNATDEVLEASIQIVNTAKDEAGRWITKIEGRLEELPRTPEQFEETVKAGRKHVAHQTAAVRKRSRTLWSELLAQFKNAGSLLEGSVEPLVHKVGLASRGDVARLEKKLARLTSQVRKLEKGR